MITRLSTILQQKLLTAARLLAAWAVRLGAPVPQTPPPTAATTAHFPNLDNLPPASGSPEADHLGWQAPPKFLCKKKAFTKVAPDGWIPETLEMLKLTAAGKILDKSEFIVCDDVGLTGPANQLKGRRYLCRRMAFNAEPCAACQLLTCSSASCCAPFEQGGKTVRLCTACNAAAEWARDLWLDAAPNPTPDSNEQSAQH